VQVTTASRRGAGSRRESRGSTSTRRRRPTPPADPTAWTFEGDSSKSRFKIQAPLTLPAGSKFHITCCFKSPRFQTGPGAAATTVLIGGGVPETNVGEGVKARIEDGR
jgi:hypothetical protein